MLCARMVDFTLLTLMVEKVSAMSRIKRYELIFCLEIKSEAELQRQTLKQFKIIC